MSIREVDVRPELTEREVRVLGVLVEKELSTPEYYPMTLNALATACSQKTNRDPVVSYDENEVSEAIESLQRKRLVGSSTSSYGRAVKYRHAMVEIMALRRSQLAILASLMLRGPETTGELRGRVGRMHEFESLEEVDAVLEELMAQDPPLVARLPRRPGQKESRYAHLFSGEPEVPMERIGTDAGRLEQLEEQVARLEEKVDALSGMIEEVRRLFD